MSVECAHSMRNCPHKAAALRGQLGLVPTCPQCCKNLDSRWQGGGAPDRFAEYDQRGRRKRRKSKKRKSKKRKSKKRISKKRISKKRKTRTRRRRR